MANVVDKRIAQLEFDNGQFEKAAQTSLRTLENLQEALNFDGISSGFSDVESAIQASGGSFTKMSSNLDSITKKFSAGGIAAATVVSNVATDVYNTVKRLGTNLLKNNLISKAIGQMKSGGMSRAANLEQAKFQLEGLGEAWEDVEPYISKAVDGTAFGLDAAAKVASQLRASNVALGQDMQDALSGISGVAAMTNSSYEDIGAIFTKIAGQGKVMTEELNQFAGRGLNVAAELAKAYNVDEATLREMVTNGEVDFKTFAAAMNNAFGEQATRANETFDGAMSNMKSALSRIGAEFATDYRKNMRDMFNEVRPKINELKTILLPFIERFNQAEYFVIKLGQALVYSLDLTPISKLVDLGIKVIDILGAIGDKAVKIFSDMFPDSFLTRVMDVFDQVDNVSGSFHDFFKEIEDGKKKVETISEPIKAMTEPLTEVSELLDDLANRTIAGEFGFGDERKKALEDLGYSYEIVQNRVNELMGSTARYDTEGQSLIKTNGDLANSNGALAGKLGEVGDAAVDASGKVAQTGQGAGEQMSFVDKVLLTIEPLLEGFASTVGLITETVVALGTGVSPLLSVLSNVGDLVLDVVTHIAKYTTSMYEATKQTGFFTRATELIYNVCGLLADILNPIVNGLKKVLAVAFSIFATLSKLALDTITKQMQVLSAAVTVVRTVLSKLGEVLLAVYNWFDKLIRGITKSRAFQMLATRLKKLKDAFETLGTMIFLKALEKINGLLKKLKIPNLDPKGFIEKITQKIADLSPIIDNITHHIQRFTKLFAKEGFGAFGIVLTDLKSKFLDFFDGLKDVPVLGTFISTIQAGTEKVGTFFKSLGQSNGAESKSFSERLSEFKEKAKSFYDELKADPWGTIKNKITEFWTWVSQKVSSFAKMLQPVTDTIKGFGDKIVGFLESSGIAPAFRSVFGPVADGVKDFVSNFKADPGKAIKDFFVNVKDSFMANGSNLAKNIGKAFGQATNAIKQFFNDFKESAGENISNVFGAIKDFIGEFSISDIADIFKDQILCIFKPVTAEAATVFDGSEAVEASGGIISGFVEGIKKALGSFDFGAIGTLFDSLPEWIGKLSSALILFNSSRLTGNIAGFIKNSKAIPKSFAKLLKGFSGVPKQLQKTLKSFTSIFGSVKDVVETIRNSIGTLFGGIDETMKSYRKHLAFKNILYLATSVAIIAGSIIALAQFPIDKIGQAGLVVIALMLVLTMITTQMKEVDAKSVSGLAILIAALAAVLIAITILPLPIIAVALAKFAGVVLLLGAIFKGFGALTKGAFTGIKEKTMVGLSASIAILAGAMLMIAGIDVGGIAKGIAVLGAFATAIGILTVLTKGSDLGITSASMLGFAAAMLVLAPAMSMFSSLDVEGVMKGIGIMTMFTVAIAALTAVTNGMDMAVTSGAMIAFAMAMNMLMGVFAASALLSWDTVGKGAVTIIAISAAFLIFSKALQALIPPLLTIAVTAGVVGGVIYLLCTQYEGFSDALGKVWNAFAGENGVISKIADHFKNLAEKAGGFIKVAKEKIANLPFIKFFTDNKRVKAFGDLRKTFGGIGDAFGWVADKLKGIGNVFSPVKSVFSFLGNIGKSILGIFQPITAQAATLDSVLGGEGGGGLIGTIASIPGKIGDFAGSLYDTFVKGTFIGDIVDGISGLASSIGDGIGSLFSGFKDMGAAGLQNLINGFTKDPLGAFSNGLADLKKWWLGEEGGDGGVWGMVKDFFKPGVDAVKNIFKGFGDSIGEFFQDPLGNLKRWWLGEEGGDGGVWGMVKNFFKPGVDALNNIFGGFGDAIKNFVGDPIGALKDWWLGKEGGDGGVWGMISGFFDAGAAAIGEIASGFGDAIKNFVGDPIGSIKTWLLGEEGGDGGVWGMVKGFASAGAAAIGGFVADWTNDPNSVVGKAINTVHDIFFGSNNEGGVFGWASDTFTAGKNMIDNLLSEWKVSDTITGAVASVKSVFFGKNGDGGVFGWASDMFAAGKNFGKNLIENFKADPGSAVTRAFESVKSALFGDSENGGVFGWAANMLEAGKEFGKNLIANFDSSEGGIIGGAISGVKKLFFGENNTGGIFSWASDMLAAGQSFVGNLFDGMNDSEKKAKIAELTSGIGNTLLYGSGTKENPGAISIMGAVNGIKESASGLMSSLAEAFENKGILQTALDGVGGIISDAFAGAKSIFDAGIEFFENLINGITGGSKDESTKSKLEEPITNLAGAISAFSGLFEDAGASFYVALAESFGGDTVATTSALATVGATVQAFVDKTKAFKPQFYEAGKDFIKELTYGFDDSTKRTEFEVSVGTLVTKNLNSKIADYKDLITAVGGGLIDWIQKGFDNVKDKFKDHVGVFTLGLKTKIALYNKKFTEVGGNIIDWLKGGFDGKKSNFDSSTRSLVNDYLINIIASFQTQITNVGGGLVDWIKRGFDNKSGQFSQTVRNLVFSAYTTVTGFTSQFQTAGQNLVSALGNGFSSYSVTGSIRIMLDSAYAAVNNYYNWFYDAGFYLVNGLAQGVNDNYWTAINAVIDVCDGMLRSARNRLRIQSPSKEFAWIGKMSDEGLTQGLLNNISSVTNATEKVGGSAIESMGHVIASMYDLFDKDMDTQPTIRPVMDMSEIISGFNQIGAMAEDRDYQFGLAAAGVFDTRAFSSINPNQNETNLAISSLRADLSRLNDAVNTMRDMNTTMEATIPVYLDGTQIGNRTADVAIKRISHIQANRMRVAGR